MIRHDFSQRSVQSELMDSTTNTTYAEFHDCLCSLATINVLTMAYSPTLRWLKHALKAMNPQQPIVLFDIGCGGGDMLRQIWKWSKGGAHAIEFVGIDLNPWSKQAAEQMTPKISPIRYETSNLFQLDSKRHADFIISSLFTHHLSDGELIRFIQWMDQHAVHGWFINDLHRHPLPYYFIKCAVRLLFSNRMIQHDAPVSVARAFTRTEWEYHLAEAGIPKARTTIVWYFPFRYGVACRRV